MRLPRQTHRPTRWRFCAALQWHRLVLIGLEEMSRVQAQALVDVGLAQAIWAVADGTAENVGDITILLQRQGSRPLPLAGLTRGTSWAAGCLVAACGARAVLAFDRWLMDRWLSGCARLARWIPPEDGITARALEAVREREAACLRALWGVGICRTSRPPTHRRRR